MELGPIFRTLIRNKTRFILIAAEVALTLAIAVNCVNMMQDMQWQMDRPTGIDEENILVVRTFPFSSDFQQEGYLDNARKADLDLLRSLPGVRAADAVNHIPLSGSGSSSGYKPLGAERHTLATGILRSGIQAIDTLGVELVQGRNFTQDDINDSDSKNVIITQAYADRLFPDGDALGKQLQGREADNPHTIIGIIRHMHGFWPTWRQATHVMIIPGKPGSFNWGVRYMVRTVPGGIAELMPLVEKRMLELNNGRNVRLETLAEIKAETYEANAAVIKMLGAVILLLVFVTALGIIGMTSFSVTERAHQIGTRRALGARHIDILRYFLTENWLITTTGIVAGAGISYGLNYALVNFLSGAMLDWKLLLLGIVFMWTVGLFAALLPAWRGARISPAIATKSV